jgi:ribosome-binding protein aMBF1 (putative translation factor)
MNLKQFKKELLKNKEFKKYYFDNTDMAFFVSDMVLDARVKRRLTQFELAKRIGTKQSSIARLELGKSLPSLSFLSKIAKALKADLIPPKLILKK